MITSLAILGLITAQRAGELALASRNTSRLLARGAVERGERHYLIIVALHAAWLVGLWILAWNRPVNLLLLGAFALVEVLRLWVLASLGERWTTRIIVVPGEPLVRRGPYRFLPHPNYLVVALEIALAPMMFGLFAFAAVFTVLNGLALWIRIRAEDAALSQASPGQGGRGRGATSG